MVHLELWQDQAVAVAMIKCYHRYVLFGVLSGYGELVSIGSAGAVLFRVAGISCKLPSSIRPRVWVSTAARGNARTGKNTSPK